MSGSSQKRSASTSAANSEKRRPGEKLDRSPEPLHDGINALTRTVASILNRKCRIRLSEISRLALCRAGPRGAPGAGRRAARDRQPFTRAEMHAALAAADATMSWRSSGGLRRLRAARAAARDGARPRRARRAGRSLRHDERSRRGLHRAPRCSTRLRGPGRRRHGQARRARAQRLLRHRPRVRPSRQRRTTQERYERAGRSADPPALRASPRTASCSASTCACGPTATSGPLACSFEFLESYFITQGREWERYAWIKARAAHGRRPHDRDLEKIVRPFVFRKYLDYATLGAMRGLHAEVRREVARRELAEHVKLGPGGIREIEFIAQALQLVRGGRDPELTARPTLQVLALLGEKSLLPAERGRGACRGLRVPAQRRAPPAVPRRRAAPRAAARTRRTARASRAMCGFGVWDEFARDAGNGIGKPSIAPLPGSVRRARAREGRSAWPEHPRLAALRASQRYAQLPDASRRRLDALVPALARAAAAHAGSRRRRWRAASTWSRRSRAAPPTWRCSPSTRGARARDAHHRRLELGGGVRHAAIRCCSTSCSTTACCYAPPDLAAFARALRAQLAAHARRRRAAHERCCARRTRRRCSACSRRTWPGCSRVERLADHLSALADLVLEITHRAACGASCRGATAKARRASR